MSEETIAFPASFRPIVSVFVAFPLLYFASNMPLRKYFGFVLPLLLVWLVVDIPCAFSYVQKTDASKIRSGSDPSD